MLNPNENYIKIHLIGVVSVFESSYPFSFFSALAVFLSYGLLAAAEIVADPSFPRVSVATAVIT